MVNATLVRFPNRSARKPKESPILRSQKELLATVSKLRARIDRDVLHLGPSDQVFVMEFMANLCSGLRAARERDA